MFLTFSLLMTVIQVQVSNSLSCLPCCEDNTPPPQTELVPEDVPVAVSLLSGEQPNYDHCHWCPPPPEYCSTGQTVKDECGCCEVCAKGEGEECGGLWGTDGTCADDLECVMENPEDPFDLRGTCQRTVSGCCDFKVKKATGQVYVVDKELGTGYCMEGCTYRKEGLARSPAYCFLSRDNHRYECKRGVIRDEREERGIQ